jgi:hypothetical protein
VLVHAGEFHKGPVDLFMGFQQGIEELLQLDKGEERSLTGRSVDPVEAEVGGLHQCSQEWDVTYTPSCFKLHPEVVQYINVINKESEKIYMSNYQINMKLLVHIICVLPGSRVWTIIVPLDLDLIDCSMP